MNNKEKSAQSGYRMEMVTTGLFLVGFTLVYADVPIHVICQNLVGFVRECVIGTKALFASMILTPLTQMAFSDLVGISLIASSLGLMIMQIRKRLITASFESHSCPLCHETLHRIHRSKWQILLSKIMYLSSGYYRCETCDHASLRYYPKTPHLHRG